MDVDQTKSPASGPSNGSLLIHGGGEIDEWFIALFKALAGGVNSKIVVIPTAQRSPTIDALAPVKAGQRFGLDVTILHTRDRNVANSDFFVSPLATANGVFFEGGRQPLLSEAYGDTRTHRELGFLLTRGGVIAGSSAGATIQGSFMVRNQGAPDYNPDIMIDRRYPTDGFSFIKNIAIDQHISTRGRQNDLAEVVKIRPELLGIGLDEDTAIHVQGDQFEVIGSGHVFVHDGPPPYEVLTEGGKYDLRRRMIV